MEYNTTRTPITIPEYGRHIHNMIDFAVSIEDREKRNKAARLIVGMMGQMVNPQRLDSGDFRQKLWDHLFIISDFRLDVDAPYDKPLPRAEREKPKKCSYPNPKIKFRQYGKSLENMIEKTMEMPEGAEKKACTMLIANMMKKQYMSWNKDSVADDVIGSHLMILSDGKLPLPADMRFENTPDPVTAQQQQQTRNKKKKFSGGNKTGFSNNGGYSQNYQRNRRRRNFPGNGFND